MKYEDLVEKATDNEDRGWFGRLKPQDKKDLLAIRTKWEAASVRPSSPKMGAAILESLREAGYEDLPRSRQVADWLRRVSR